MVQIFSNTRDDSVENIHLSIDDKNLDFVTAKNIAKKKAFEKCDHPMILSWKNGKTGESHPDYECGSNKTPFWIRYAEGRGANLVIDVNDGDYTFMVLKV